MSVEEWRAVVGFEGLYEVSDAGRVRRIARGPHTRHGLVLSPSVTRWGYLLVTLYRAGRRHYRTVHSLVASAFVGPRPDGKEVNHRNGQKSDNTTVNLEYLTKSDNQRHAIRSGLRQKPVPPNSQGERNPNAKLTLKRVEEIRTRYATGSVRQIDLAAEYGVSQRMVSLIVRRENWKLVEA